MIGTLCLFVYYLRLDWRLTLVLAPILLLLLWLSTILTAEGPTSLALWVFVIVFFFGVILHAIGYYFEEKRATAIEIGEHLILAPLVMAAEVCFISGRMPDLKGVLHNAG